MLDRDIGQPEVVIPWESSGRAALLLPKLCHSWYCDASPYALSQLLQALDYVVIDSAAGEFVYRRDVGLTIASPRSIESWVALRLDQHAEDSQGGLLVRYASCDAAAVSAEIGKSAVSHSREAIASLGRALARHCRSSWGFAGDAALELDVAIESLKSEVKGWIGRAPDHATAGGDPSIRSGLCLITMALPGGQTVEVGKSLVQELPSSLRSAMFGFAEQARVHAGAGAPPPRAVAYFRTPYARWILDLASARMD